MVDVAELAAAVKKTADSAGQNTTPLTQKWRQRAKTTRAALPPPPLFRAF